MLFDRVIDASCPVAGSSVVRVQIPDDHLHKLSPATAVDEGIIAMYNLTTSKEVTYVLFSILINDFQTSPSMYPCHGHMSIPSNTVRTALFMQQNIFKCYASPASKPSYTAFDQAHSLWVIPNSWSPVSCTYQQRTLRSYRWIF